MDKEIARETKSNHKKLMTKFLPKALTFQNIHFSPGREHRYSDAYKNRALAQQNRGFSGPLISLVPIEARGHNNKKSRDKDLKGKRDEFDSDVDEPRSPKVSCIGQIKNKKKLHKLKRSEKSKNKQERLPVEKGTKKNTNSGFGRIFSRKSKSFAVEKAKTLPQAPPPGLSQMKRFSSGRDAFANFDWTKQQVAPVVGRECYSDDDDEQRRRRRGWDDDDEEEEEGGCGNVVMVPFSAPMMIGGVVYGGDDVIQLEPRKEICLWKKRNMPPPKPLKLNTFAR